MTSATWERVYIPMTSSTLADLVAARHLAGPFRAHAVTPALREEWPDGDEEEWEYAATYAAAEASWALRSDTDAARRYVLAVDVPSYRPDEGTQVVVESDVPWRQVASLHADTDDVAGGDDDSELAWWATQEIPGVI